VNVNVNVSRTGPRAPNEVFSQGGHLRTIRDGRCATPPETPLATRRRLRRRRLALRSVVSLALSLPLP
jgi:hypothetical protein